MKKIFCRPACILLVLVLITGTSCSKNETFTTQYVDRFIPENPLNQRDTRGGVMGALPFVKSETFLTLSNHEFSTTDFYYTKDGSFRFDRVPEGLYNLTIVNRTSTASTEYRITSVKVRAGFVNSLGLISF